MGRQLRACHGWKSVAALLWPPRRETDQGFRLRQTETAQLRDLAGRPLASAFDVGLPDAGIPHHLSQIHAIADRETRDEALGDFPMLQERGPSHRLKRKFDCHLPGFWETFFGFLEMRNVPWGSLL